MLLNYISREVNVIYLIYKNLMRKELQIGAFSILLGDKLMALTTRLQSEYKILVHTVQSL